MSALAPSVLVRGVRPIAVGEGVARLPEAGPVDLRIAEGVVVETGQRLTARPGEEVHEGGGAHVIPGLWDHHVHMGLWSATYARVDMAGTSGPDEVLARLRAHLATLTDPASVVVGFGHRSALWPRAASVAELDAACGAHPVILISGDAHNGWVNSAALRLLGAPPASGLLAENDWFPLFARIADLPGVREATEAAYQDAIARANALGIVGIGDMEFARGYTDWPARFAAGRTGLRVRVATYAEGLDEVVAAGLRTGDALGDSGGLLTMGPLKIISDGSLNTRSAYCFEPYADGAGLERPRGWPNLSGEELAGLLRRAAAAGLQAAVHAIGDAAIDQALGAFETSGARGSIEHAQLIRSADIGRMARLGVAASVQPAHLLDDRDVTEQCWPDRVERCYAFRWLLSGGVELRLGSDAPVSPLDPWLAMAAAVHRSADEREPWVPGETLTAAQALAASTDGQGTVGVGSRADLVLLESDPFSSEAPSGEVAARLRAVAPVATFVAGRLVFGR